MVKITDLEIVQEFTNDLVTYGLYYCKFNGDNRLFTRNGDKFKALIHWHNRDELCDIRDEVVNELLYEIENAK